MSDAKELYHEFDRDLAIALIDQLVPRCGISLQQLERSVREAKYSVLEQRAREARAAFQEAFEQWVNLCLESRHKLTSRGLAAKEAAQRKYKRLQRAAERLAEQRDGAWAELEVTL